MLCKLVISASNIQQNSSRSDLQGVQRQAHFLWPLPSHWAALSTPSSAPSAVQKQNNLSNCSKSKAWFPDNHTWPSIHYLEPPTVSEHIHVTMCSYISTSLKPPHFYLHPTAFHAVTQVCGGDDGVQHHAVQIQGPLQGPHSETTGN